VKDNSDPQYRSFRDNLLPLVILSSLYLLLSHGLRLFPNLRGSRARAVFISAFATIMLVLLHGVSTFKIALILGANYFAAKMPKPSLLARFWPGVLITANMGILFMNEQTDGYKLGRLHAIFEPLVSCMNA
jgi:hypothetical protein